MATITAKPSLTIKRRFKAAPEKVFSAWTDPEKVKRWMGPGEVKVLRVESDPRTGGRFRWVMQAPSGEEHDVSGVYREVIPNEKLVLPGPGNRRRNASPLVTLTFKRRRRRHLVTMIYEQFFDETARDKHNKGWTSAMDKLDEYLAT